MSKLTTKEQDTVSSTYMEKQYLKATDIHSYLEAVAEGSLSCKVAANRTITGLNKAKVQFAIDGSMAAMRKSSNQDFKVLQSLAAFLPALHAYKSTAIGRSGEPIDFGLSGGMVRTGQMQKGSAQDSPTAAAYRLGTELLSSVKAAIEEAKAHDTHADKILVSFYVALENAVYRELYGGVYRVPESNLYEEGALRIHAYYKRVLMQSTSNIDMYRWNFDNTYGNFSAWVRGFC